MKNFSISILRALVVLLGIGALAFLLWQPTVEGVNAHATTFSEIYLDDPFLAYAYIASIPFFVGLYQLFTFLGSMSKNKPSAKALQTIKYCAITMIPLIAGGVTWLLLSESDDRPPVLMMGLVATVICIGVASVAGALARHVHMVVDIKSENHLTV